jgi:hypothetical protein
MRQAGLSGLLVRRRGRTTIRVPGVVAAPDLVARDFNPIEPDRLWAADLTEIPTWEGVLYLAVVIDCYSRRVVGWAMAEHRRAELVVEALEMAVWQRKPTVGLVHHSDQGSQSGFKGSSQRLDGEELRWASGGGVGLIEQGGCRCVRRVVPGWRGVRIGNGSGRRSPMGSRANGPAWPRACRRRLASGGLVRVAGCRRSAGRRCRDATCRSPSARRSRS